MGSFRRRCSKGSIREESNVGYTEQSSEQKYSRSVIEKEEVTKRQFLKGKWLAVLLLVYLMYIALGGVVFHYIEETYQKKTVVRYADWIAKLLANNTCITSVELLDMTKTILEMHDQGILLAENDTIKHGTNWDFTSSMFFATTILTTIGYGNITPETLAGRMFAVGYAIFGIPLFVLASSELGARLHALSEKLSKMTAAKFGYKRCRAIVGPTLISLTGYVLFSLGAAAMFSRSEKWSFSESTYYTFITLTTIGFGDYYPRFAGGSGDQLRSIIYIIIVIIWIICGLVWMAFIISVISDWLRCLLSKLRHSNSFYLDHDLDEKSSDTSTQLSTV